MREQQQTIKGTFSLVGKNLFTGASSEVTFQPLETDRGLIFLVNGEYIAANLRNAQRRQSRFISSIFLSNEGGSNSARLVEHLLSPIYALGIDNLLIELNETGVCPTFDDIALTYYSALKGRIKQQDKPRKLYTVDRNKPFVGFTQEPKGLLGRATSALGYRFDSFTKKDRLIVMPSDSFSIECDTLKPYPAIGRQHFNFDFNKDDYATEVANARTFCFPGYKVVHDLIIELGENYWHGATDQNCAFVLKNANHYANIREEFGRGTFGKTEFPRHKTLDAIGEFALLGKRFVNTEARFIQTGHSSAVELLTAFSNGGYIVELPSD